MAALKKLTAKQLERFLLLDTNRKTLDTVSRSLKKQQDALKVLFTAYVMLHGGPERLVLECGHRLTLHDEKGQVDWQQAFIDKCGEDAAEALRANPPKRVALKVEKVTDKKGKRK